MLEILFALLATIMPACPTEDSTMCVWSAQERGNGIGHSFVAFSDDVAIVIEK